MWCNNIVLVVAVWTCC